MNGLPEQEPRLLSMGPEFSEYLRDESRLTGEALSISFPSSEAEIRETLAFLHSRGIPVTLQGARTGITGGAVPRGGHVLNLSRCSRLLAVEPEEGEGRFTVRVEPGLLLQELNDLLSPSGPESSGMGAELGARLRQLRSASCFFSPDPTETGASLGGMAACNASGARSYFYGPMRPYVQALRAILADGSLIVLRRGQVRASGRAFRLPLERSAPLQVSGSAGASPGVPSLELVGRLPDYRLPAVKNAAGYYIEDDMDLLDLFIGSEGTLALISELTLRLLPRPQHTWGVMAFLSEEQRAVQFVEALRELGGPQARPSRFRRPADLEPAELQALMRGSVVAALEYFDRPALELLEAQRRSNPAFAELPQVPRAEAVAVYVELQGDEEPSLEARLLEVVEALGQAGGSEENAWMATTAAELQRLKDYRHALPEAVNLLIDERRRLHPELTKLGTDMAVPDSELEAMMRRYREDLAASGLQAVKFGHIGDNHLHVNILPRDPRDYEEGRRLYECWAEEAVARGGTVSAEHGVGKLKAAFLKKMYGERGVQQMRALRALFDPAGLLNRENLTGP